jgi:hypothetical protein
MALLLTLALWVAGCSRTVSTSLPAEVDQHLAWIPKTAEGLAYFDLQGMRQSELGQQLEKDWSEELAQLRGNRDYQEFLEKTGFDFEKDLQHVLVGMESGENHHRHSPTLVVMGNFDERKIISAIDSLREAHHNDKKPAFFTEVYGGKTLYVTTEDSAKALYFADVHTVVFGKKTWMQTVIDGKTTGESVKQNEAVTALMQKLPYKDQCWMIANTQQMAQRMAEELGERENFKGTRAIKSLQGVIFSAHVGEKANLYGEALCDNEENSKLLADAAKGALSAAKLSVSDDREAVDMLNRFAIEPKGKSVKFSADLDKAFFNKLREKAEKHGKAVAIRL